MFGFRVTGTKFSDIHAQFDADARRRARRLDCTNPTRIALLEYDPTKDETADSGISRYVRCRKCRNCLKKRQEDWGYRAEVEHLAGSRTWWITLTYRGHRPPSYEDVKRYFKRLRKHGLEFRYVVSEERGTERDRLHWHVLMHTTVAATRRRVERAWKFGYVHARLARSAGLARYMSKYLAKVSRLRASVAYGGEDTVLKLCPTEWAERPAQDLFIVLGLPLELWHGVKGLRPPLKFFRSGVDWPSAGSLAAVAWLRPGEVVDSASDEAMGSRPWHDPPF